MFAELSPLESLSLTSERPQRQEGHLSAMTGPIVRLRPTPLAGSDEGTGNRQFRHDVQQGRSGSAD